MTANQKFSPTRMWLKQFTTSTFSGLSKGVDRVAFLRRNKKGLGLILIIWVSVVIAGYTALNRAAENHIEKTLENAAAVTQRLADQSGSPLLEDDLLGLIRIVSEFTKDHRPLFAAVLNHENKIVAHSDTQMLNQSYAPSDGLSEIKTIGEVTINAGLMPDGTKTVTFLHDIMFSGVTIGRVVYAVGDDTVFGVLNRYRLYKMMLVLLSTLSACGLSFWLDWRLRKTRAPSESKVTAGHGDALTMGPYRLRKKIAQGGMAELYIADYLRQDGFRRAVAIKKVLPHLIENQDFIKMFVREARLAALLQHPNIVQIFDFGQIHDTYFIAMEYIHGLTLGQIMAHLNTGLPVNMSLFLIMKVCLGLDYSHKRKDDESGKPLGIVHRDISPQNILISFQGEVKISDFGISKANTEPSLTQVGVIKGKLAYLSPEQALGKHVDHQADIYALGLMFYESLTGKRIYQFDSDIEAIRAIPEMEIPPIKTVRQDIPDALNDIVMKCLVKDKALRYREAMLLHNDLMQLKSKLQLPYDASDLSLFMRTTFSHD